MARYFKFHSLDDIRAEVQRLGLSLRFDEDLSPLFRPVSVGPLTAGNALCIQPMEGCDCTPDGHPDELTFRRYRRFGAGGAKLIWAEAAAVADEGRANPRQLLINDATIGGIARMFNECRQAHAETFGSDDSLVIGLQLTHSGRYSCRQPLIANRCPLLDPRTSNARELTDDDLERLPDLYVKAARLARDVGYHFVDVKQCHRYLLNEMLGARGRPGRFGGEFEGRTRLARTIFERLRAEVPGIVLATRMNVFDGVPFGGDRGSGEATWGTDPHDAGVPNLSEPIRWVGEMRELGVAMVNVSLGNPYASPHLIRPFEYPPPDGYETPEHPLIGVDRHVRLAEAIQRAYPDLPVVGSGYSYLQEFFPQAGAANLAEGRATFVGVGRASLSMPDFGRLLKDTGKLDRKRVCRTFSYCTALMRSKHNELGQFATGCPPFDKDAYGPLWELAKRKP